MKKWKVYLYTGTNPPIGVQQRQPCFIYHEEAQTALSAITKAQDTHSRLGRDVITKIECDLNEA